MTRKIVPSILNGRWIDWPASRGKCRTTTSSTFHPAMRQRA